MALLDNILGSWDLDTDSGDRSGNGNNGTDTNVTYGSGKATLTSSTSQIALAGISLGTTHSLACWINLAAAGGPGTYHGLFGSNGRVNGLFIRTSKLDCFFGSVDHFGNTNSGPATVLTHVGVSVTAGAATFYTNGVASGSVASGVQAFTLVSLGNDNGTDFLNGTLQSVNVWSRALSAADFTTLYNGGTPLKYAGMKTSNRLLNLRRRAYA